VQLPTLTDTAAAAAHATASAFTAAHATAAAAAHATASAFTGVLVPKVLLQVDGSLGPVRSGGNSLSVSPISHLARNKHSRVGGCLRTCRCYDDVTLVVERHSGCLAQNRRVWHRPYHHEHSRSGDRDVTTPPVRADHRRSEHCRRSHGCSGAETFHRNIHRHKLGHRRVQVQHHIRQLAEEGYCSAVDGAEMGPAVH
jgi:hypothetical protein